MSTTKSNSDWYDLGLVEDIPLRGARRVVIEEKTIGIFRTSADSVYAIDDKCPHQNGPLSQGIVHDNCVTCPLHNWVIDLSNGEAVGADEGRVNCYQVKIVDGRVRISSKPLTSNDEEVVVKINAAD